MFSLSKKLTLLIVGLSMMIGGITVVLSYHAYRVSVEDRFVHIGESITSTVAEVLEDRRLARYTQGGETDEEYQRILSYMRILQRDNSIEYLYVVQPTEKGLRYLFDTDQSDSRFALGSTEAWPDVYAPFQNKMLNGQYIAPFVSNGPFGSLLTILEPIHRADGTVLAYAGADISRTAMITERQNFLAQLILTIATITVVFSILSVSIIRRIVIRPINAMAAAADDFFITTGTDSEAFSYTSSVALPEIRTNDELETLSNAMHSMVHKIDEYFISLCDITKKAETDALTGLQNRAAFTQAVDKILSEGSGEKGQIHAFFMIDADHFKDVNDNYGHTAGDAILKECADGLRKVFRTEDIVGRMGGDEFAVFCKNAGSMEVVHRKAEQICMVFRSICLPDVPCMISASVGMSIAHSGRLSSCQTLYEQADSALYEAKERGKNGFSLYSDALICDQRRFSIVQTML